MSVNPSSPVSDASNASSRPGLSRKARFWIGLLLAVIIPVVAGVLLWLAYRALFPNNQRLVVNSVRLAGDSGYWSPSRPDDRQARLDDVIGTLNIEPGKTPMFSDEAGRSLAEMAGKLRKSFPELERADIWRVLPDQLIFELHERIPVADLGSNFFIDDIGTVLDKNACKDWTFSLPTISCKQSVARGSVSGGDKPFERGEVLTGSPIRTSLDFIWLVKHIFTDVDIKSIYVAQDSIQCHLCYKNKGRVFTVLIPLQVSKEALRNDYFGRLIPRLESSIRNGEDEDILDMRFKDRIVARSSKSGN